MARALVLKLGDEESRFGILKVDREKLYGKKERVVVDEENRPCAPAWLTADGSALVPLGGTAHVWIDERWTAFETDQRKAVDAEGQALPEVASTLDVAQLAEPVAPERLLEHVTHTVYELDVESLGATLKDALDRGLILECPFSYRGGHDHDRAFVVQNDQGIFALVGSPTGFQPLSREVLPEQADGENDELEGDLDFSML
jgi:hypothetical protein